MAEGVGAEGTVDLVAIAFIGFVVLVIGYEIFGSGSTLQNAVGNLGADIMSGVQALGGDLGILGNPQPGATQTVTLPSGATTTVPTDTGGGGFDYIDDNGNVVSSNSDGSTTIIGQ